MAKLTDLIPLSELAAEMQRRIAVLDAERMNGLNRGDSSADWGAECYAANQLRTAVDYCRRADRKLQGVA